MKETLRKFSLGILATLLGLCVVVGIPSFSFYRTVGNPEYLKSALSEANVYGAISDQLVESAQSGDTDPQVALALKKAADSSTTKSVVEGGIDGIFGFLTGKTSLDDIALDISPITDRLSDQLAKAYKSSLSELPKCKPGQAPTGSGALELSCKPANLNTTELVNEALLKAEKNNPVLEDGKLSLADIQNGGGHKSNSSNKELSDNLNRLAILYRWSHFIAPDALIVGLLSATGIVLLSSTRWKGLRRAGWTLAANGTIIAIAAWVTSIVMRRVVPQPDKSQVLAVAAQDTVKKIVLDLSSINFRLGLLVLVLGLAVGIPAAILYKKSKPTLTPKPETPINK